MTWSATECVFFTSTACKPHLFMLHNRLRGVGHLDHVWSYGVREVVSSIPDRGNIVGWVFHPDQVTGKVFSSEYAFPSKFWIYLEHCNRGEAVITGHLRLSSRWGSQPRKKLPFRPLLLLLQCFIPLERRNDPLSFGIKHDFFGLASVWWQ